MSVNSVNQTDGSLTRVAGGTLYADLPVGTISPFGGSTIPNGYLLCDGTAYSRTDYADLFAVIGTAFGSGDGSTTFNVPDLREAVPVGSGTRGSDVTEHDTYDVGEFKDDQLQNLTGSLNANSRITNNSTTLPTGVFRATYTSDAPAAQSGYAGLSTLSFDASRVARTGTTTHGKQLGVNYIIKAKQTAVPLDIKENIKSVVESASDFADFQSKMADW